MSRLLVWIVPFVAIAGCSGAGSGVRLEFKPPKGEKRTYHTDMELRLDLASGGRQTIRVGFDSEDEVIEAGRDSITIRTTFQKVTVKAAGLTEMLAPQFKAIEGTSVTQVFDRMGRLIRMEGDSQGPTQSLQGALTPEFGDVPLHKGAKWTAKIDAGGQQAFVTYQVEGYEKVNGKEAVVLTMEVSGDSSLKAVSPPQIWVEVATGRMVRSIGTLSIQVHGASAEAAFKVEQVR